MPAENSTKVHYKKLTVWDLFTTRISKSFLIYPHSNNLNVFSIKIWSEQSLLFLENILNQAHFSKAQSLSSWNFFLLFLPLHSLSTHQGLVVFNSLPTFAVYLLLWVHLALSNDITPLNTWLYLVTCILYFKMAQLDLNWVQGILLFYA